MLAIKKTDSLKQGKIVLTGVLDEEQNSIGTIDVVESGIVADGAIIAECTQLKIETCQRGLEWLKFHFVGKTVHGSRQREGINAIAKAVSFINAMEEKLIPKVFARTHPLLKEATVNYGVIHGGTQLSTVAGECDLFVDTRFLPYQKYEDVIGEFQELLDELAAKDPQFKCEMSVAAEAALPEGYVHLPFETPRDHPLVNTLQGVIKEVTEEEAVLGVMPAWTDGGLLSPYGHIPTVILGPGGGNAHAHDEYIPVDHLTKTALIYALAAVDFCKS
jgi:acetylornithine deacetylase/succinyl-diaminopimelate desuccinylase